MNRQQHNRPRMTREEQMAGYLEAALMVAADTLTRLADQRIDAPALVAQRFVEAFPMHTTTEEIRTAILARSQAPRVEVARA